VVLPAGYRDQTSVVYPVVLVLAGSRAEAAAAVRAAVGADGAVTVVATPGAATTAAALGRIGGDLGGDVRVTAYGWGLVATTRLAPLAAGLVDGSPGRYAGVAWIGSAVPVGVRLNGPVAVAVVRAVAAGKSPVGSIVAGKPPGGKSRVEKHRVGKSPVGKTPARKLVSRTVVPGRASAGHVVAGRVAGRPVRETVLSCPPGSVWAVAGHWAAGQTPRPLRPAVRLPAGAR
jgi:hypothetical protein